MLKRHISISVRICQIISIRYLYIYIYTLLFFNNNFYVPCDNYYLKIIIQEEWLERIINFFFFYNNFDRSLFETRSTSH